MDRSRRPPAEDKPARIREIVRILSNRGSGIQHMQDCRAAYLALKHSFECMNPELNSFSIHRLAICRQALAASVATEALYADLRKVSHAKWTSDSAWPSWASIAALRITRNDGLSSDLTLFVRHRAMLEMRYNANLGMRA